MVGGRSRGENGRDCITSSSGINIQGARGRVRTSDNIVKKPEERKSKPAASS